MHPEATPVPIPVSRTGVCVVDGYGIRVSVERGRLLIRDGTGRSRLQLLRSESPICFQSVPRGCRHGDPG